MDKIKSCPFCGSVAKLEIHKFHGLAPTYGVKCTSTDCRAQVNQFYDTAQEAIDAWNRRNSVGDVKTLIFDIEEIHENCTVQVLQNSVTGEISVGWWENEQRR